MTFFLHTPRNLLLHKTLPFGQSTPCCRAPALTAAVPAQMLAGMWEPYPIDMAFQPPCMVLSTIGLAQPGKIRRVRCGSGRRFVESVGELTLACGGLYNCQKGTLMRGDRAHDPVCPVCLIGSASSIPLHAPILQHRLHHR